MKSFKAGDLVKFVPYYTASGMQGGSLKKMPAPYDCLGLVIVVYKNIIVVMIPPGRKVTTGFATADVIASLK
jgi:hypothetical protein